MSSVFSPFIQCRGESDDRGHRLHGSFCDQVNFPAVLVARGKLNCDTQLVPSHLLYGGTEAIEQLRPNGPVCPLIELRTVKKKSADERNRNAGDTRFDAIESKALKVTLREEWQGACAFDLCSLTVI